MQIAPAVFGLMLCVACIVGISLGAPLGIFLYRRRGRKLASRLKVR